MGTPFNPHLHLSVGDAYLAPLNPVYDEMSSAVAEKQAVTSEEDGSAPDLSLTNGVSRDYELKCVLSEYFLGAPPSRLTSRDSRPII